MASWAMTDAEIDRRQRILRNELEQFRWSYQQGLIDQQTFMLWRRRRIQHYLEATT